MKPLRPAIIRSLCLRAAIAVACLMVCPRSAHADVTAFVGGMTPAGMRQVIGGSAGRFLSPSVGVELEVARAVWGDTRSRRRVDVFTVNYLIQTPTRRRRPQLYGSLGFGIYGETTSDGRGSGEVGVGSMGAGVKVRLAGPLRIRLEYRLFRLGDPVDASPDLMIHRNQQRVSIGVGVAL